MMNDEGKHDGPRMRWLADHYVKPHRRETVRGLVERAAEPAASCRRSSPGEPPLLALGAAGLVFSQAPECAYVTGVDPTGDAFAAAHADALVQLLLGPPPEIEVAGRRPVRRPRPGGRRP